jgi:hypothetical protein
MNFGAYPYAPHPYPYTHPYNNPYYYNGNPYPYGQVPYGYIPKTEDEEILDTIHRSKAIRARSP